MKILNYLEFINENKTGGYYNFDSLPMTLKEFFEISVRKNILSKVIGYNNFSIILEGEDIYFLLNGVKIFFPFIKYREEGTIFYDLNIIRDSKYYSDIYNSLVSASSLPTVKTYEYLAFPKRLLNTIGSSSNPPTYKDQESIESDFRSYTYELFHWIKKEILEKSVKTLNPFTDLDIYNNPIVKILDSMGFKIDSSERRKAKGVLRFSSPNFYYGLILQPNGYLRIDLGEKTPILTTNMELSRPIQSEEDLNIKLTYLVSYVMRDILKKTDLPKKERDAILKSFTEGEYEEYSRLIKEVTRKYPTSSLVLPDPNNVIHPSIKKSAQLLTRFGISIFD